MQTSQFAITEGDFRSLFIRDVLDGLQQPKKSLPSKYFYDSQGSQYFDQICNLEEYYPYRTELSMLPDVARDLNSILQNSWEIVEFGAGSLVKIRLLLQQLDNIEHYVPIDIAGDHLRQASDRLQQEFPQVSVLPIEADFTQPAPLPETRSLPKLGFFPGSTIGNFSPEQAQIFLSNIRQSLGKHSRLLIGVDTKKDPNVLHNAYNDSMGVTAAFNRNILTHINRICDANFDSQTFAHYAFYNPVASRIEMHLISTLAQEVNIDDQMIAFSEGENIHTENSYKYTPDEFLALAATSGWDREKIWQDKAHMFSIFLLSAR
ncbi:L-histidine N(alpha)-methyltransferase [Gynuella sp.]|uniref:L-histidine N(alpha)-methyltransferase n=1 Tax=Gynuella sp. TaxID=2969146 RepID=UPI003D14518C